MTEQPEANAQARLGVGTATFIRHYGLHSSSWQPPDKSVLRLAVDRGIRYLDTAASYGDGEAALGDLSGLLDSSRVRVCTKVEVPVAFSRAAVLVEQVAMSLSRLRSARIDTVLAHSAGRATLENPELAAAWSEIKRRRLTIRTGASTYGVDDAGLALRLGACDVVQVEYSILNQEVIRAVAGRKRSDQELVVRSVLCKGLLTARRGDAPPEAGPVVATLADLDRLAISWGFTLPELAIRFALDTPGVDIVLVGVQTVEELETALRATRHAPLDDEQMGTLRGFDRSALDCVHPERWGSVARQ